MVDRRARTFRILAVCTGNQCRSPAIERILGQLLVDRSAARFEVESAGTSGPAGLGIHPLTCSALHQRGVPFEDHVSQILAPQHIERASLVLTAERTHRRTVAELVPGSGPTAFTLVEFARLAPAGLRLGVMNPEELVAAAATVRSRLTAPEPYGDDLGDPISGDERDHEVTVAAVQQLVAVIADALLRSAHPPTELSPKGRRAHTW